MNVKNEIAVLCNTLKITEVELAKELGLESKELIKKAKEVGIEVTSHLSSLEEEQIQKKIEEKIRKELENDKREREKKERPSDSIGKELQFGCTEVKIQPSRG